MFRKTLTILSLIGLLLSVGLWGVSQIGFQYSWHDYDPDDRAGSFTSMLDLESGTLIWSKGSVTWSSFPPDEEGLHSTWAIGEKPFKSASVKFGWWPTLTWRPRAKAIELPLWIPTALFAPVFVTVYGPQYRRRKRKKLGLCVKCGYDLRASKDRCPECNTAFEP